MSRLTGVQRNVLTACAIGGALGYGTLGLSIFGQFVLPLAGELGRSPQAVALSLSFMTLGATAGPPAAGALIDRFGARPVIVISAGLMALTFVLLSAAKDLTSVYILYGIVALTGSGTLVAAYSRPIVAAFGENRGMALGVMLATVGIGAALLQLTLVKVIAVFGVWGGYLTLAVLAIVGALPSLFLLPRREQDALPDRRAHGTARELWLELRTPVGLKMMAIGCLLGVFTSGVWGQAVPLLVARGLTGDEAALAMAGLAIVLTVTRFVAGFAMDRIFAPFVGAGLLIPAIVGWVLLAPAEGGSASVVAVLLLGLGVGVEFDLFSYLISKYVPRHLYASYYGALYSALSVGGMSAPIIFARTTGSAAGPIVMAMAVAIAVAILLCLPSYELSEKPDEAPAGATDQATGQIRSA